MTSFNPTLNELSFMRSVEGFDVSAVEETALGVILSPEEIRSATAKQTPSTCLLIEFLRSNAEISAATRHWLADLLEDKRDIKLVLEPNTNTRPRHTRVRQSMLRRHAARYALAKQEEYGDTKLKRSVEEAASMYGIDVSSIRKEIRRINEIYA